ncbi:MAG: integrase core domain-containing protein, partial [Pseudomonadota bacterium]
RLWRNLKYECVHLHAWATGSQARAGIRKWVDFQNTKRWHTALGGTLPAVMYRQAMDQHQPDQQVQLVD